MTLRNFSLLSVAPLENCPNMARVQVGAMFSSWPGHVEIARLLVEAGADKYVQDSCLNTALMWASRDGHEEIAQLLVASRGAAG